MAKLLVLFILLVAVCGFIQSLPFYSQYYSSQKSPVLVNVGNFGMSSYHLVSSKKTWTEARSTCYNARMSLLSLSSKEEETFISKILSSNLELSIDHSLHVGAKQSFGKWWWTTDEKSLNWMDSNGPNTAKNCLSAVFALDHNVTFTAIDCDVDELEFICEKRESLRALRKLKQM